MKNNFVLIAILSFVLLSACKKDADDVIVIPEGITYKVTFDIDWNSTDFPTNYPANAHFSPLIGWSHQLDHTFFQTGTMASAGIKSMAETGSTSPLNDEIKAKVAAGEGLQYIFGDGLGNGTGQISLEIVVNEENTAITLATMIAPSPDWYIAVVNINLFDEVNKDFIDNKVVNALVYDAGTDDGTTYTSPDNVTTPQKTISLFVDNPLGNGVSLNAPIASVTFKKL